MTTERERSNEFRLLMARNQHLEKVVAAYKQVEEWENFEIGTRVYVCNSDSLHDRQIGKFIAHFWEPSGYVCLLVEFPDGKRCYYLPNQLMICKDEPIAPTPKPDTPSEAKSKIFGEPTPEPTRERTKFRLTDQAELDAASERIIEAKLEQVAKMPESVRKKILSSTLSSGLVPQALEIAIQRGIIPAF